MSEPLNGPYAVVLGVCQDAGHPHPGCKNTCCAAAWQDPSQGHLIACLGIIDPLSKKRWIIDASPDLGAQLHALDALQPRSDGSLPVDGVFVTHAHIGHYTGLSTLGREGLGAKAVPLYVMPRMEEFVRCNGPWSQLVKQGNVELRELRDGQPVALSEELTIEPFIVPHRDEYSETVGFRIKGPKLSLIWLPDIDAWAKWDIALEQLINEADYAFIDGTFFDRSELSRDIDEIPHPLVSETMALLGHLPLSERRKVHFIHLNHTNPLLQPHSAQHAATLDAGFCIGTRGQKMPLT